MLNDEIEKKSIKINPKKVSSQLEFTCQSLDSCHEIKIIS